MSFTLNEPIPHLPIQITCQFFETIRLPALPQRAATSTNENMHNNLPLTSYVTPRQRWKLLQIIEIILCNSVPLAYRRENHNKLIEVAYMIEKTLFALAILPGDYLNIQTLRRRVLAVVRSFARRIMASTNNTELKGFAQQLYLMKKGHNHGAGAA
uniref:Uncharacterized protein n=1 Tax=Leptocylindrus danicus TaxID=163516 RepID=A0A7S2LHB9_9STRA|mmetsp:Transcript_4859/g.7073  ORF Transcript_4859/g.7073 Transcript_4859/m.7073 type:complete len:156 (+) Transcript_4859:170-637(+)|eukprot:CAMPEP_0116028962 /NCGR_PEP_ID=MMETSP0321-20121206/15802_1 /TAXON_ID=163516 /ORGANISM="Leptocylindrus danicus var. danicus, Strain B650" /LENGTH=155 /DNA_ID=CAMNT_0003503139 /DNA_START=89 /DNA_END=556 /DNA_ORIENTATION=+